MKTLYAILVLCGAVALLPAFVSSGVVLNLVIMTLYATLLGQAWNILAGFLLSWWLKHSRYGAWLTAVRDDEDSAAALGVDVFRVKLQAIVISAGLMAAGGAFYVQYFQYIDPHLAYGPAVSVEALLGPIVGGLGTVFGPLLGAAALKLLGELTRNLMGDAPGVSLMIYGAVLIAMVTFLPRGIAGLFRRFARAA